MVLMDSRHPWSLLEVGKLFRQSSPSVGRIKRKTTSKLPPCRLYVRTTIFIDETILCSGCQCRLM
ncbi:hypothetical protein HOLleu_44354 [Holothuria leucospilota]|uniref:Uncharacterized protein n=1 Tax=Holothuria leucospilota TaxID=206669 RepID=A0A9Q0Y8W9_HOLLE|nr:hypothetical protein HOLleu_44354 [Holothuria leucospilota]